MFEDRQLLKRVRCGNVDALRRVYEKYREDLFTVAVSLLRDVHGAEDCIQDVFLRFARGVGELKIRGNLKAYLVSCAANRARDLLRKKRVYADCSFEELRCAGSGGDPACEAVSREELGQVFDAVGKLPFEQREVFVLRVQGDLKFREIARLQGVSIRAAQGRYRYAIEKLRKLLQAGERL